MKDLEINSTHVKQLMKSNKMLMRRVMEMEFIFHKVTKNSTQQQDALKNLETRTNALSLTEQRLRKEVQLVEDIKEQMEEKFKMLRNDRSTILKRMDNTDSEIGKYRSHMEDFMDSTSQ